MGWNSVTLYLQMRDAASGNAGEQIASIFLAYGPFEL